MGIPTGTVETYDIQGEREDLENAIYDISPIDTPCMSHFGRRNAKAVYHEWQIDALASPKPTYPTAGYNAAIEGDDAADPEFAATTKPGNYTQIQTKTVIVSGTADAVDKAGRKAETAYQIAKKGKELKRDMETTLTGNQASNAGAGEPTTPAPRRMGSMEAWYETNVDKAGDGSNGGFSGSTVSARTDGTARAIQESQLKSVLRQAWTSGGEPDLVVTGPVNKQNISAFTGHATRTDRSEDKRVVASVDVYVHDFGEVRIIPNRWSRDQTVHVVDPSLWSLAYLRTFRQWPLARTGDSEKRQLLVEWTLVSKNEAGSGIIADLTTS